MDQQISKKGARVSMSGVPSRLEQADLARAVGARLREARDMVGLSQITAAKQLGYANSTKLAKIESGKHSSQIPIWVIKRAAELYDVSVDYLLGITESMEREDARHSVMREMMIHMRERWEKLRERDVIVQMGIIERVVSVENCITSIEKEATDALTALNRVIELNPEWEDIKGGSKLLSSIERTTASSRNAKSKIRRFRTENAASGGLPQIDLVFV